MDSKHAHVEGNRNNNQAEETGKEMFEPKTRSNSLGVAEKNPELEEGKTADPCDGEEANPLNTDGGTETETAESPVRKPGKPKNSL